MPADQKGLTAAGPPGPACPDRPAWPCLGLKLQEGLLFVGGLVNFTYESSKVRAVKIFSRKIGYDEITCPGLQGDRTHHSLFRESHGMNFNDLLSSRYSCRKFAPTALEKETIEQLLQAGRLAPSACNAQPYFFYAVGPESMARLDECRKWYGAPNMILGCIDTEDYGWQRESDGAVFSSFDIGLAMSQMALKATELNLGSCFIASFDPGQIKRILGLPEYHMPYIALVLGHAQMGPNDNHYLRQSPDKLYSLMP